MNKSKVRHNPYRATVRAVADAGKKQVPTAPPSQANQGQALPNQSADPLAGVKKLAAAK